jgi:hypothetical protein
VNPFQPSPQLLCKLGSIVVHVDELLSPRGHEFDKAALLSLFQDVEVNKWLAAMRIMALIPEKRHHD